MLSEPSLGGLPPELDLLIQLAVDDNRPTVILNSSGSHPTCIYKNLAFQHALAHVPSDALEDWIFAESSTTCATKATPAMNFANREWIKKKLGESYIVMYCKHVFVSPPAEPKDHGSLDSMMHDWINFSDQVPINPWIRYLLDYDWSKTAIGAISGPRLDQWPIQLRELLVSFMHCPQPRMIYWGPDLIQFYNESASKIFGARHPAALGNKQADIWGQELCADTTELIRRSWEEGQSVYSKARMIPHERDGFPEESYFDWFLLPFAGSDGRWIASVNCFNEVTSGVLRRNREDISFEFLQKTTHAVDLSSLWLDFLGIMDEVADDIAYTLLYTVQEKAAVSNGQKQYSLFGSSGLTSQKAFETPSIELMEVFERTEVGENVIALTNNDFLPELGILIPGYGPVTSAFAFTVVDVKGSAQGSVVVGINPRRPVDDNLKRFIYSLSEMLLKAVIILQSPSDQRKLLQADTGLGHRLQLEKLTRQLSIATLKNEKNHETFSRMAEDAPIGMFIYRSDGGPVYMNDTFLDLLGETREGFIEKSQSGYGWRDCIHPDDEEFSREAWQAAAESHDVQVFQFRVRAGTESSPTRARWLEVVCFPHRAENGVLVTLQGYLTDITNKKLTEALTTERMNAAIDTKRKAQNFIDMISHEMRNPLSSIIQLTESVISIPAETLPPEVFDTVADAAHTISICALHMKVIIDEVLDFSKLDSNLLVLAPERTRPREIIEKALKMFEAEMKNSDIKTEVEELPSDCFVNDVLCDPSRLLQIIINLITNALKFTRNSDIRRITLAYGLFSAPPSAQDCGVEFIKPRKKDFDETETVSAMLSAHNADDDADNVYLMFSVTDTGCGLTSEESQLLFQRFAQAPKTYKQYGGSGLGLFISRELVELQKGQIGLHSEPSVGSRFAFYIQAKHAARRSRAGSVASVESTISVKNVPHSVGGSFDMVKVLEKIDMVPQGRTLVKDMHVLLVEDNLINSKVMAKQLRKLGCEVDVAENGLEALNHLSKTTYLSSTKEATPLSLILLDVEMPIMDGLTCIRRIRALEQSGEISGHVPVIAITANARNEQIAAAIEAGMDSVVTKPFTIKDLVPQMEALVDTWSSYG
ncbi:histidine kinase, partial [Aureobasidium melanogenum]